MGKECTTGRVTIPTDVDVVPETLELVKRWGADAIRDCDGTEFPAELKKTGAKIYATYYTTRKDNAWAKAHPEEIQQIAACIRIPIYVCIPVCVRIPVYVSVMLCCLISILSILPHHIPHFGGSMFIMYLPGLIQMI